MLSTNKLSHQNRGGDRNPCFQTEPALLLARDVQLLEQPTQDVHPPSFELTPHRTVLVLAQLETIEKGDPDMRRGDLCSENYGCRELLVVSGPHIHWDLGQGGHVKGEHGWNI